MIVAILKFSSHPGLAIELASRIMMPLLLTLLLGLVVFSISLPGAEAGLKFYLQPDWSLLTPQVVIAGVGQAFFSLSLGMGAMITYGSYLGRRENLLTSAAWVAGMDTCIAVLASGVIRHEAGLEGSPRQDDQTPHGGQGHSQESQGDDCFEQRESGR